MPSSTYRLLDDGMRVETTRLHIFFLKNLGLWFCFCGGMQTDLENQKKKKEDEKALKELRAKAAHLWYRKAISIRNTVK